MTRHRLAEAVPPDHYAAATETQRRLLPRVVAATVLILALVAALLSATADAADDTEWFVYAHVCDGSECHSIALPVESCTGGGQAALAQWVADHPGLVVRAFKCLPGDSA